MQLLPNLLCCSFTMRVMILLVGWLILFALCWPLALLALILWPFVWLVSIPFRLVGITFEAVFAFLKAVLMLPARIFGGGKRVLAENAHRPG
jgi:hypothetical protein